MKLSEVDEATRALSGLILKSNVKTSFAAFPVEGTYVYCFISSSSFVCVSQRWIVLSSCVSDPVSDCTFALLSRPFFIVALFFVSLIWGCRSPVCPSLYRFSR